MYESYWGIRISTMSYLDVYFSRINHLGETTGERIRNGGIRSFERWLDESPFTVRNLSVERGLYFEGIIEENKDKEHKKIMFLQVANDIPLLVGDIMNWPIEDGTTEKWLITQEEKKTNPTYKTFLILKCNYFLKWVNKDGHVQESWSHCTSSLDSMIKGNYRTWHNLISPQPNKFLEVLMPRPYPEVKRSTNFIVEEESWNVIDYDHTSVPGTVYISLTEGKVNSLTDDIEDNLADKDKIAIYTLSMPPINQKFKLGARINPVFTLMKNGKISSEEVLLDTTNKEVARFIDGILIAVGYGQTELIATLKDHPEITQTITIDVAAEEPVFSAYIEGIDKLKLNRATTYILKGTSDINEEVSYRLAETELAEITDFSSNSCTVKANANNKLGSITLIAKYKDVEYTKEIKIIPLW